MSDTFDQIGEICDICIHKERAPNKEPCDTCKAELNDKETVYML